MIILTLEEIKKHGISGNELSEIVFQNKTFTKGSTYSQRFRESAIVYGQEYSENQGECVIVDCGTHLTLWLEKKTHIAANTIETKGTQAPPQPKETPDLPKTKADSPPQLINTHENNRPLRKYRGSYY